MTETVLVLPLIFVVLALLFFFGQAMTRWQRSSVTDRYEAWRQAQYAPGPGAEFAKNPSEFGDADLLNQAFFADNADTLDVAGRSGRVTVTDITDTIAEETTATAPPLNDPLYQPTTAGDMVRSQMQRLPAWWRIDLATEHLSDVPLYQRFAGAVHHQSTVIDGDWAYGSWIEQLYRGERDKLGDILVNDVHFIGDDDRYDGDPYPDLDDLRPYAVQGVYHTYYTNSLDDYLRPMDEDQENPLAHAVRLLYLSYPGYRGPQVLPELSIVVLWYVPQDNLDEGDPID